QTIEYKVGAVFLATGVFGFRAVVEEIDQVVKPLPKIRFSPLLQVEVKE
nr:hypothetical protein [Tanacetum cinerariifolium]